MANSGLQGIGHIPYEQDEYWEWCCDYLGYECPTKKQIYSLMEYTPLPKMEEVHKSTALHRIVAGGNRSGKSYMAAWDIIPYLLWHDTSGWIVSDNYDMADEVRQKIVGFLQERLDFEESPREAGLEPYEYYYSSKNHKLVMPTGSTLQLKSAESPDSMHAVPLDWILVDEAALLPYILYDTRLVPRLADTGGWIMSIGTFEWLQGEWFEEYYDIGRSENDLGIKSWHHPTSDNYHVYTAQGGETKEQVGKKYHINWHRVIRDNPEVEWPLSRGDRVVIWNIDKEWLAKQKKRVPDEIYSARYDAKTATSPYLVFPKYQPSEFVDKKRAEFDDKLPVYLAIDPGGSYALLALQLKTHPDAEDNELTRGMLLSVIDEIYFQTTVTTQEVYEAARHREWWPNVDRGLYDWWDRDQGSIDARTPELKRTWQHLVSEDSVVDSLVLRAKSVGIESGNQTLQHFIDTNSLAVSPKAVFLNLEFQRYHYPQPSLRNVQTEDPRKSKPRDEWNHAIKALIYFIVGKFGYYGRSTKSAVNTRRDFRKSKAGSDFGRAVVSRYS